MTILVPQFRSVTLRRDADTIYLIEDGHVVFSANYKAAIEIAKAIIAQAKVIEEENAAMAIARDQAILTKAGVPISLTGNQAILEEAKTLMKYDKQIKEIKPVGGINKGKVGTPTVIVEDRNG